MTEKTRPHSLLTEFDVYLFRAGKHRRLYEKLGSHPLQVNDEWGTYFAVWAPNAEAVSVIGPFNNWKAGEHPLFPRWDSSGIWEGFLPGHGKGTLYKYAIQTKDGRLLEKGDPFAFFWEVPPKTASIVWDTYYNWEDEGWMYERRHRQGHQRPMSVYEVHLGSWKKKNGGTESLSYRELADELVAYVQDLGFTHVEFMPVMEHPFFPSWGYQVTGYFAPTSRFGQPEDFMYLIDRLHQAGIGVLLDWVPSHFPNDPHGLAEFDGTHLYDHADPRKGFHPDWKSCIFNYGRFEVRSFLLSNALFWLDRYHADGLRVDAVASMLYLDYSRKPGEWIPNQYGGNENLEAISFLREFNEAVYGEYPDAVTIAEESTAWGGVSRPTYAGGLGFGQKWMMGWMHDTLNYFKKDPVHRKYHHNEITFSLVYAFTENFMLPLSHDEVVHGKGSLISRMPGDEWQRFANLRALFGYQWLFPGKQLLFMGGEIGQSQEWSESRGIDWWLLEQGPYHLGVQRFIADLNRLYREHPAFWEADYESEGFHWVDCSDARQSVLAFLRQSRDGQSRFLVILHLTPNLLTDYRLGVSAPGFWREALNSDSEIYGGSNAGNLGGRHAEAIPMHGHEHSVSLTLPPLSVIAFEWQPPED